MLYIFIAWILFIKNIFTSNKKLKYIYNLSISNIMNTNQINNLISFQRKYRYNKINESLKLFRNMYLDTMIQNNQSYDKCIKLLCTKKIIISVNNFLSCVQKIVDSTSIKEKNLSRILLSSYLLKYYPDTIFTNIDLIVKKQLTELAKVLVFIIEHSLLSSKLYKSVSLNFFLFVFNSYVINYKIILEADKQNLIIELYREYANISITKQYVVSGTKYDKIQIANILQTLDSHAKNIKEHVKLLDKNYNLQKFDEAFILEENKKYEYNNNFWISLAEQVDIHNFENVLNLLEKIKNIIYDMTPESKKHQIKNELSEYIDIEFIKQKIHHNVMSRSDIMNLCFYLWTKIEYLQASVRDTDTMIQWKKTEELFISEMSLGNILSIFFKNLFKIIDDIFCDVLLFTL